MSDLPREAKIRLALLGALMVLCHQVSAATFNVADGDVDALKIAIASANANGQNDTIDLAPDGTYLLASVNNSTNGPNGLPVIGGDSGHKLTINGHGAVIERSTIFTPAFRILQIGPGADVTLDGLTIVNGLAMGLSPELGGGIFNDRGTLSVTNCTLRGNSANLGGWIYNNVGSSGSARLSVTNSTFRDNFTTFGISGGGSATLSIIDSTFSFNSGAAIVNDGGLGNATLRVTNSTFSGGICIANGSQLGDNSSVEIGNSILQNPSSEPSVGNNTFGTVTSLGYNLSSDDGGGFLTKAGDQINKDPMLDPAALQDNGGPTDAIALLPGSPAIDKGKDIGGTGHDQRGLARPFDFATIPNAIGGDGSDIGALELKDTDVKDADGDRVPDSEDACPNSDLRPTVFVDTCNTMVPNGLFANGCTMADLIAGAAAQPVNNKIGRTFYPIWWFPRI